MLLRSPYTKASARQTSRCSPLRGAIIFLLVVPMYLTRQAHLATDLVVGASAASHARRPFEGSATTWQGARLAPRTGGTAREMRAVVESGLPPTYQHLSPHVWQRLNEIEDFWPSGGRGEPWPGGRVPYVFADEFDLLPVEKLLIKWTMRSIESNSCVRFVARGAERDYVSIVHDSHKCYSSVGRVGGEQRLSLGLFCTLFWDRGNVYHELLHALGLYHEHTRPDRDHHVEIRWRNIKSGMEANFRKDGRWTPEMLDMPYDIGSVMHYSSQAFSKLYLLLPTIVARGGGLILTRPSQPSELDYAKLNRLYSCPKNSRRRSERSGGPRRLRGRARRRRKAPRARLAPRLMPPPPLLPSSKAFTKDQNNVEVTHQAPKKAWRNLLTPGALDHLSDKSFILREPWGHSSTYRSLHHSIYPHTTFRGVVDTESSPLNSHPYVQSETTREMFNSVVPTHATRQTLRSEHYRPNQENEAQVSHQGYRDG